MLTIAAEHRSHHLLRVTVNPSGPKQSQWYTAVLSRIPGGYLAEGSGDTQEEALRALEAEIERRVGWLCVAFGVRAEDARREVRREMGRFLEERMGV